MGTRCLTFVYTDEEMPIIKLYRQYDGYPDGHGRELAGFLNSISAVTNGISAGDYERRTANGMPCLAAQMVAHFKKGVGGFYLYNVDPADHWQDYEYHVYKNRVKVTSRDEKLFEGTWQDFESFCNTWE